MARLHVAEEEEAEDSPSDESLPELLSVLSLRDTSSAVGNAKPATTAPKRSNGKSSKMVSTNVGGSIGLERRGKTVPGAKDAELVSNTSKRENGSSRPLATISDKSGIVSRTSQKHISPARGRDKKVNRNHYCPTRFIEYGGDYKGSGSDEDDSVGSLADFVVDDEYISYESGSEQENKEGLRYDGRDGHGGNTKAEGNQEPNHRDRSQARRPLASIPDNPIVPERQWESKLEKSGLLGRPIVISSETEEGHLDSEEESLGSLVDFVVDDDHVSYISEESEGEGENRGRVNEGKSRHVQSEANRDCFSDREERLLEDLATKTKEQWNNDKVPDSSATDSLVSVGPRGILNSVPISDALHRSPSLYKSPVIPSREMLSSTPSNSIRTRNESKPTSPRKLTRIPTPPPRLSEDAFWHSDFINKWNDQHSPRKPPFSKKSGLMDLTQDSSRGGPSQTTFYPLQKSAEEIKAKRLFDMNKDGIARAFLAELDEKLTNGRISNLTASSGGVKIIWNKKMHSSAGAAMTLPYLVSRDGFPGEGFPDGFQAQIDLSEKLLDDEERLIDTLAHGWAHVAHGVLGGGKGRPHGREFKSWLQKAAVAFPDRKITVSVSHNYEADYKYLWQCTGCGLRYGRHCRSIDPARTVCGVCCGPLIQIKPRPRLDQPLSAWQLFLKKHLTLFKSDNPTKSHKEIMKLLAREYYREGRHGKRTVNSTTVGTQTAAPPSRAPDEENPSGVPNGDIVIISNDEEDECPQEDWAEVGDNDGEEEKEGDEEEEEEEDDEPVCACAQIDTTSQSSASS
ncbi:MAG: hypothetical protein M1816_006766 [Peltula sp. TS41687]|nr:MAG: hypothetical protein M1816_006766 [Peltula sp. TS41687]